EVLGDVARLPPEVRQIRGEVRGVLAGARADLEHHPRVPEDALQDGKDRHAVAFARFGIRFHRMRCSFNVVTGPSSAPIPSVAQAIPHADASVELLPLPARSSAHPNTNGLTTPAPNPTTERTA